MLYILFAALCSVSVSILLKYFKRKHFDIFQILAFNYFTASSLCMLLFKPDLAQIDIQHTGWLILFMGVLLPSIFWCLDRSLQHAGLFKTEIAQRISVVLTLLVSALIYQEQFSLLKIAGLLLGVLAVVFMLLSRSEQPMSKYAMLSLLSVWVGYALTDLLFKYTATLGLKFSAALCAIFITASLVTLGFNLYRQTRWQATSIGAGVLLGGFNFANIALYLHAHQQLSQQPSVVFASMNILVVVLGMLAAILIFKEKANATKLCGGLCAILAIWLLMLTMH